MLRLTRPSLVPTHGCLLSASATARRAARWLLGAATAMSAVGALGQTPTMSRRVDWGESSVIKFESDSSTSREHTPLIVPQWRSGNARSRRSSLRNDDFGSPRTARLPSLDDRGTSGAKIGPADESEPIEEKTIEEEAIPVPRNSLRSEAMGARDDFLDSADTEPEIEPDTEQAETRADDDGGKADEPAKDGKDGKDAIVWRPTRFCNPWGPEQGEVPYDPSAFAPDPDYSEWKYQAEVERSPWDDKIPLTTQRPWIEFGRGLYRPGRIPPSETWMGSHNLVAQHFLLYGDFRSGLAYIDAGGKDQAIWANRLNLDLDWKITATERVHAFIGPLDRGPSFTRVVLDQGELELVDELDKNFDTGFFEGDLGAILGGIGGYDSPFDLPFTVGLIPLLFQNGIWMEDALVGAAFTLPARHSSRFNWSNYDLTFFAAVDRLNSPAFGTDDSAAHVYGVHWFLEAYDGYFELGYAALDDQTGTGKSYHNIGASFTRRYFQRVSNSVRVIINTGQDPVAGPRTADGQLVILENALISSSPNTFVPYCNLFGGFGRPQSVGRAAISGGVLRNTGILFETDGLTGFPFLDDTANNTYGGAMGVNWLGPNLDRQVILEVATVQTFGRRGGRTAAGDQYGIGARYQKNLNHAWLFRADALYGFLDGDHDLVGVRTELRHKF